VDVLEGLAAPLGDDLALTRQDRQSPAPGSEVAQGESSIDAERLEGTDDQDEASQSLNHPLHENICPSPADVPTQVSKVTFPTSKNPGVAAQRENSPEDSSVGSHKPILHQTEDKTFVGLGNLPEGKSCQHAFVLLAVIPACAIKASVG
jgi:hypothetical protein